MLRWLRSADLMPTLRTLTLVALTLVTAACGNPPSKEMDQAQGAIDAARAAGGDKYATAEFGAAVDSLKRSEQAAAERDYRLALNDALESREHAQNAAREAADTKAQLRGTAERTMAELAPLLADANTRLQAVQQARGPARVQARVLRQVQDELATLNASVQKAGDAMTAGDYLSAGPLLDGVKSRIEKVLAELEATASSQSPRRRR